MAYVMIPYPATDKRRKIGAERSLADPYQNALSSALCSAVTLRRMICNVKTAVI